MQKISPGLVLAKRRSGRKRSRENEASFLTEKFQRMAKMENGWQEN